MVVVSRPWPLRRSLGLEVLLYMYIYIYSIHWKELIVRTIACQDMIAGLETDDILGPGTGTAPFVNHWLSANSWNLLGLA